MLCNDEQKAEFFDNIIDDVTSKNAPHATTSSK